MKKLSLCRIGLFALAPLCLASCMHVRGVVVSDLTQRPIPNAQFTVGRPGMMVMERHNADKAGHFDFYINPLDETNLYVWDGKGDPEEGVQHIDRLAISDHMTVHLQPINDGIAP